MNRNMEVGVARLDGYLQGIAALSGNLSYYSAGAFFVKLDENEKDIHSAITRLYLPQAHFHFINSNKLERGMRDLESGIRSYLIRDILGISSSVIDPKKIVDRELNTSFWVMDMIRLIVEALGVPYTTNFNVSKLEAKCIETGSQCVFFCVLLEKYLLVLQFNDDTLYRAKGGLAQGVSSRRLG